MFKEFCFGFSVNGDKLVLEEVTHPTIDYIEGYELNPSHKRKILKRAEEYVNGELKALERVFSDCDPEEPSRIEYVSGTKKLFLSKDWLSLLQLIKEIHAGHRIWAIEIDDNLI